MKERGKEGRKGDGTKGKDKRRRTDGDAARARNCLASSDNFASFPPSSSPSAPFPIPNRMFNGRIFQRAGRQFNRLCPVFRSISRPSIAMPPNREFSGAESLDEDILLNCQLACHPRHWKQCSSAPTRTSDRPLPRSRPRVGLLLLLLPLHSKSFYAA